jgi:hypothetical protein
MCLRYTYSTTHPVICQPAFSGISFGMFFVVDFEQSLEAALLDNVGFVGLTLEEHDV